MPGGLEKLHGLSPFLAWCLSSSLLISLSLTLSFCIPCSFTFFALLSLFTHHLSHSSVLFSLLCPYQSLDVIAALLPSSPSSSVTYPYFYFSHPYLHFLAMPLLHLSFCKCVAQTIPLVVPVRLPLDQHDWAWPQWVLFAGQFSAKRSVLRRAP